MPTTTLSPIDSSAEICAECSRAFFSGELTAQCLERKALSRNIVFYAALDERRAVHRAPRRELLSREPMQREDFAIERAPRLLERVAAECKAQERYVLRGVVPAIDADER